MGNLSDLRDVGAKLVVKNMLNAQRLTADSGNEGSQQNGVIIDRRPDNTTAQGGDFHDLLQTVKVSVAYTESVSTGETATVAWNMQHSSSTASSAFSDYNDIDGTTGQSASLTTASGSGVDTADFDLAGAKRYVRLQVTGTVSATASDTLDLSAVGVFGGADINPISTP